MEWVAAVMRKAEVRGAGKADWKEVCSDGIDPAAQAGTREEVGKKPWHG